ncbi:probable LRR receptor-like serine/threonine-protein kinase At3g47570 [Syzygium oleosum]|uniref:probable LRR receptor-like serine/threonine-protein kinase At3g47570 n=1 Tax=Syzygium oleosum TaxID=219896 RepID=UPI0024BB4BD8|nr:probable LRR receptor-like serine/threonine-protein kinase At3g47570 [Syzygium oleosum]
MADGKVVDPPPADEPVAMDQEPGVWYEDPEPMAEEVEQEPEPMDQDPDEDGEVAELGSDEEVVSEEELDLYLDLELEIDSEDEWAAAQEMESEESEPPESSSGESSGDIPKNITGCTNLIGIGLQSNRLTGQVPRERGRLLKLQRLVLMVNNLSGSIPPSIGNLSSLEDLYLTYNYLSGSIPGALGQLAKPDTYFGIQHAFRLSGTIPFDLKNLRNLTYLNLSDNKLSGVIPSFLHNLSKLIYLYLAGNNFQGRIPSHLDKRQRLMSLDLSSNNLSGSVIPVVTSLFFLNLPHNLLTGALPKEIGEMKNLNYMDLSGNMLDGEIPSSLGNCDVLVLLRLQDNLFEGSIPQSISSLRGIKVLDLSCNNLSGGIPRFFEAFDLEYANFSFNNFEGSLPTEGVFQNASAAFVIGNEMLCGGIPEFHLPECISGNSKSKRLVHILILSISIPFGLLGIALLLAFLYSCWLKEKKKEPISSPVGGTWQNLSYGILLKATNGFSSTNLIGIGSFGSVYKGTLENGTVVAVKVLNLTRRDALKSFMAECKALKHIRHRNLLKILSVCSSIDYYGNEFKL